MYYDAIIQLNICIMFTVLTKLVGYRKHKMNLNDEILN